MSFDSFFLEFVFNNKKTEESAKKIETVVDNLKKNITKAFTAIASFDFLKNAVTTSIALTTQLDNLSYSTNINREDISAWGEAVKRVGGTAQGFFNSLNSLSAKLREMQTSYGTAAGQGVFARLGINLVDSNHHMKTSIQLLTEIGDKFKNMPKVWQMRLGEQLGLDMSTIRLISSGSKAALELVDRMKMLGGVNELNAGKNIQFRNSLYDLMLIWQNIKITVGNALIPILNELGQILIKVFSFWERHAAFVNTILISMGTIMGIYLVRSAYSLAQTIIKTLIPSFLGLDAVNPIFLGLIAIIGTAALFIDDFTTYLNGGNSAMGDFYDWVKAIIPELKEFMKIISHPVDSFTDFINEKILGNTKENVKKATDSIKDMIKETAKQIGVDPEIALTIAARENSKFDPLAKSTTSSAEGLFQITDATYKEALKSFTPAQKKFADGLFNSGKSNPGVNALAGVINLKNVTKSLTDYFGRAPQGYETYIGEMFGASGARKIFGADKNTMLSSLFDDKVIKSNPQYANMTTGQLINTSQKNFNDTKSSLNINSINVNVTSGNPQHIAQNLAPALQDVWSKTVTNADSGRIQ